MAESRPILLPSGRRKRLILQLKISLPFSSNSRSPKKSALFNIPFIGIKL